MASTSYRSDFRPGLAACLVAALGLLAACDRSGGRAPAEEGVETLAPYSTTATAVTGELALSRHVLTFAEDLTYQTGEVHTVPAGESYGKGAGSWASLVGVDPSTQVEIRAVTSETIGAQAGDEGLCGKRKTTHLALIRGRTDKGAPALHVIATKGWGSPGPYDDPDSLCGVFTYADKKPATDR